MKANALKEIISKYKGKEGEHLEFKLSTSALSKDIWETVSAFSNEGYLLPEYLNDIRHDTFTLVLPHPMVEGTEQVTEQVANMMDRTTMTLEFCKEPRTLKEIMQFLGLKHRPNFIEKVLNPLLEAGLLSRTIPDKPRSRFQKYVARKGAKND